MYRTLTILTAAWMIFSVSGVASADQINTTGDKIKLTDTYKNNGSMRKVEVDGAEYWVPTPSSSERKLKKAEGNACCKVTIKATQHDEISHVKVRCMQRRRPVQPRPYPRLE